MKFSGQLRKNLSMPESVKIIILYGGVSSEREISLKSGAAIADVLEKNFEVELLRLDACSFTGRDIWFKVPLFFQPYTELLARMVPFRLRWKLLGIEYCGSDAVASRLCMAKDRTRKVACEYGVCVPRGIAFDGREIPPLDDLIAQLGPICCHQTSRWRQ